MGVSGVPLVFNDCSKRGCWPDPPSGPWAFEFGDKLVSAVLWLTPPAVPSADGLCCSFFEGQWTFHCGGLLAVMTAFPIGAAFALCWCH